MFAFDFFQSVKSPGSHSSTRRNPLLLQQTRPQHAGHDHREQPHQPRSARRPRRPIRTHRRPHLRRPAHPRRAPECRSRSGRTLGDSRSAHLHLPPASRREVSRRTPADFPRRQMDFRFSAARQNPQHQVSRLPARQSHRDNGRLHRRLPPQRTFHYAALESF